MLALMGLGLVVPEIRVPMFEFMANPIILEFLLGCLIGWLYQNRVKPGIGLSLSLVILAILGLGLTIGLDTDTISRAENVLNHPHVAFFRVLVWGIPSALLVAGLVFLESNHRLTVKRSLILSGDASYSIYLTHFFVLTAFDKIWLRLGLQSPDLFIIISVISSSAIGIIFYLLVEKNLLTYLNSTYRAYCQRRVRKAEVPLSASRKT
jgi:peptidoglycan/LPS O-acetylase OafA/YrhL